MLEVPILGLSPANPVIVGSGLLTDQERTIRRLLGKGAGAVVTKTIHPSPLRASTSGSCACRWGC